MKKIYSYVYLFLSLLLPPPGFAAETKCIKLKQTTFSQLPGWNNQGNELKQSLKTFQKSCKVILKLKPDYSLGNNYFNLTAKDWYPTCKAAQAIKKPTAKKIKNFFLTWFKPVAFHKDKLLQGKFTAYYLPIMKGSLSKTSKYTIPIYGVPSDLIVLTSKAGALDPKKNQVVRKEGNKILPYYTRQEINNGAIKKTAKILAWVAHPLDRLILGIEGSGIIHLTNGKKLSINYATSNGKPYTPFLQVLEEKGIMSKKGATMDKIRNYFLKKPQQLSSILNHGESFSFFTQTKEKDALGVFHTPLTAGYSLATDPEWIPFGSPIWLNTKKPAHRGHSRNFKRLMIAQDTGGAIRGPVRGDLFLGSGKEATHWANNMHSDGYWWLLVPKHINSRHVQ